MTEEATTRSMPRIETPAWLALGAAALLGFYLIGLDQGQTLSLFMGDTAYQQAFLHELFHDVRHLAALPCH